MNKSRIVGAVVCSALLALAASGHEPMTPDETINSFEDTFDVHSQTLLKNRTRICATGEFMGTPQASALSRSMIAAAKADPNAGMPDVQKLHEFLAAHPGAFAQSNFVTATASAPNRVHLASTMSGWRAPDGAVVTILPTRPSDASIVQQFVRELARGQALPFHGCGARAHAADVGALRPHRSCLRGRTHCNNLARRSDLPAG
jgi:hypothetical protein